MKTIFGNTAGVTRTLNLRIWNPLLCQLSYRRPGFRIPIGGVEDRLPLDKPGATGGFFKQRSLALDLVHRVLAQ